MLQYCMLTDSDFTGVIFVYNKSWMSLHVSVTAPSGCLITHGLAQLCHVTSGVKSGTLGTRSGGWGRERGCRASDCTAELVFITSRCAAVESGPELTLGGGSRELLPRGQQWGGGSSGQIFLLLLLLSLFFCFSSSSSSSASCLFSLSRDSCSCSCLRPKLWPEKVVAGVGEMRAAAAPWWRPGPCAPWPPSPIAQAAPVRDQGAKFKKETSSNTNKDQNVLKQERETNIFSPSSVVAIILSTLESQKTKNRQAGKL